MKNVPKKRKLNTVKSGRPLTVNKLMTTYTDNLSIY